MRINKILPILIILFFSFSLITFSDNNFSFSVCYDIFAPDFNFKVYDENGSLIHTEPITFFSFSTYFLHHKNPFFVGGMLSYPFISPANTYTIIQIPSINLIVGLEKEIFKLFILGGGIGSGLSYIYVKVPLISFEVSKLYFEYEFFLSLGIKLINNFYLKGIASFRYFYTWNGYYYYGSNPLYSVGFEYKF